MTTTLTVETLRLIYTNYARAMDHALRNMYPPKVPDHQAEYRSWQEAHAKLRELLQEMEEKEAKQKKIVDYAKELSNLSKCTCCPIHKSSTPTYPSPYTSPYPGEIGVPYALRLGGSPSEF